MRMMKPEKLFWMAVEPSKAEKDALFRRPTLLLGFFYTKHQRCCICLLVQYSIRPISWAGSSRLSLLMYH